MNRNGQVEEFLLDSTLEVEAYTYKIVFITNYDRKTGKLAKIANFWSFLEHRTERYELGFVYLSGLECFKGYFKKKTAGKRALGSHATVMIICRKGACIGWYK